MHPHLFLLFVLTPTVSASLQGVSTHYRENIPRFKHIVNEKHEVFLGDKVKLDCQTALSKTPAVVEWYRNEKLLIDEFIDVERIRKDNSRMTLQLSYIDVSDQGLWSCRVHNAYGQISRNFTIEVIDFCDYFLIPDIPRQNIPMECVCLWRYTKEAKRPDVDFRAATGEICKKYANRMINRARKPFAMMPCFGDKCGDSAPMAELFEKLKKGSLEKEKAKAAKEKEKNEKDVKRVVLQKDDVPVHDDDGEENSSSTLRTVFVNGDTDDEDDDDDEYNIAKPISPDKDLKELNVTVPEAPHYPLVDGVVVFNETHALPAGRTLKLNCRALGHPEPWIRWYKNDVLLSRNSSRNGGYEYKFKRWSLEIEDAVVADSGDYRCEAWNTAGFTRKFYNVIIVNRMRSPPIIVPNILSNQSVNVNDTATFNCKVVSDLLPHIMWVRINKVNGSYSYFNNSAKEFMFNYTEMDTVEKAHVHHVGDESTLTIWNVSLEDQGIYACLSGNSLGMTMENATLTVNEFMAIHLLTGDEPKPDTWSTTSMIFAIILLIIFMLAAFVGMSCLLYSCNLHKKGMLLEDTVGLMQKKKKRVVVSKRPLGEDEDEDGLSPYQIQIIETPMTKTEVEKKARKRQNSENTVLSEYEVDSDPKWEIDRERLDLVHMLGEGAFGEVWKANLKEADNNEVAVAVKKLKMSAHEKELIDLVSEMETFKVIGQHENVLRLIGCCTGAGPLYVVVELCKYGNLRDFLRAHRPKEEKVKKSSQELTDYLEPRKQTDKEDIELIPNLTQRHLVQFAWQVARGMNFLAGKKIVHRDLAARNVLVGHDHVLKISDFGLSRDVHVNDYYRKRGNGRLPIKWMALEALDSNVYTIESDVWSYGVLLWEIMTLGGTPYPTIAMPELYANLKEGYRMEPPHLCPQEVYHLMCTCWREKLEERPSFELIVNYFDWMLNMTTEPIEGSQEFNDQLFSERSTASGPVSPVDAFHRKRKHRPLSAPVNLPSEPQHTICDDYEPDLIMNPPDQSHLYCNDNVILHNHLMTPETSQLYIHQVGGGDGGTNGYVAQDRLVRAVSGVANQSLDSALGSPAWPPYSSNSKASCLDVEKQNYYYS